MVRITEEVKMIELICISIAAMFLTFTHILAFSIGRRLGAKEGIDYCFEQQAKKLNL